MHPQVPAVETFGNLKFQLSLLQLSLLGAETPQAEELEMLLSPPPHKAQGPKQ